MLNCHAVVINTLRSTLSLGRKQNASYSEEERTSNSNNKATYKMKRQYVANVELFLGVQKTSKNMTSKNNRVPVVQKMDNIIHWKIAMQWIIVDKTYRTIHWMVIYLFFWHLIVIPAGKKGLRWNRFWSSMIVWVITQCFQWNVALTHFPDSWTTTSL